MEYKMGIRHGWVLAPLVCFLFLAADTPDRLTTDKEALSDLQIYVGSWRGAGQVRRGSNEGSWVEQCDWMWKFSEKSASLDFTSPKSKYFLSGSLRPAKKKGDYQLTCHLVGGKDKLTYTGRLDKTEKLILNADKIVTGLPSRVSIRLVARGNRLIVLYEKKSASSDRYQRLAEVGYTRKGSNFGKGTVFVECVVTGGKGTIPVSHKGKTYYVCCSGCRDAFNDDPAGILADYFASKEEEKSSSKKN